jgi:hypothetical protein
MSCIVMGQPFYLRRFGIALVTGMLMQGCAAQPPAAGSTSGVAADQAAADVPRGAIQVGEQVYQVPIGEDDDGCPMFRMYSPTKLVAQVISYRDAAGGFTTNRQEAVCASGASD